MAKESETAAVKESENRIVATSFADEEGSEICAEGENEICVEVVSETFEESRIVSEILNGNRKESVNENMIFCVGEGFGGVGEEIGYAST